MHPWRDASRPIPERAAALLADLTLEEKAHQLGSFWPSPESRISNVEADVAPMESALNHNDGLEATSAFGLGHITRNFGTEPVAVARGLEKLRALQAKVVASSPHAIPAIAHEECLTGFTAHGATVYPAAIAWGATFDPEIVMEMAQAIGEDMAALGIHQGLSPLLDVVRDYRWGRVEETLGEDPYLVGTLGAAYVRGLQSSGVDATLKHFAGYSAARAGRNHAPVSVGPREFEDVILQPFEIAVREGGAHSVMNSYSDVDGVPAAASRQLLTETLRQRWGFNGTVVSDYWSVTFLETMHKIANSPADAARLALEAGLDVELPATGGYRHIVDLVRAGILDERIVDTAVLRVLEQKVRLGLLDQGWAPETVGRPIDLDSSRNRDIARRLAEESIVLAANNGILPLRAGKVALIGPCAAEPRTFLGCYSFPNHVLARYDETTLGVDVPSLADALDIELPDVSFTVRQGCPVEDPDYNQLPEAVAAAQAADVVLLAVGDLAGLFGRGTSGEGCDAADLKLPGFQADLVEAVLATGTPTVLIVISGRPYSLGRFASSCAAVVQAFMPGAEGGSALAGVLSGRVNPSGRLPIGIPDHPGGQPGTYLASRLGWFSEGISNLDPRPLYPFGHGLSYSSFELVDLALNSSEIDVAGQVEVSVTLRNTGERDGSHVVQLYASDVQAQVVRPVKELIGYARVELQAGASRRVTFTVHADRLSFTGTGLRRVVEPGEHILSVGHSSEDRPLLATLTVVGQTRVVPEGRQLLTPVSLD